MSSAWLLMGRLIQGPSEDCGERRERLGIATIEIFLEAMIFYEVSCHVQYQGDKSSEILRWVTQDKASPPSVQASSYLPTLA